MLRRTVRGIDTPVRLGGDEFCVLAIDQTAEWAEVLARRVLAEVERVPEPDGARAGVSIGVASCPEHGTEPEPLLELADAAMNRAKAATAGVAVAGVDPLREPAGVRPE